MKRRKKVLVWSLAAAATLLAVGISGGRLFLHSQAFQRVAIRTLVDAIKSASGARAEIGALDLQLSSLTVRLYNITLHGSEAAGQPPLLHVDKLTVGIQLQSLLRRKFTLTELAIERPVAYLAVNRDGRSNLPQAPSNQGGGNSTTGVFDLAAQHVRLSDGQVNYRDRVIPLDAELYDLRTEIHFDSVGKRYQGSFAYDNGRLRYAGEPTLAHALEATFSASSTQFSLSSAVLRVGSSSLALDANLTNYSHPTVDGRYDVKVQARDLSAFVNPVAAEGEVGLSGVIHYRAAEGQPALRGLTMDGQVASAELSLTSPEARLVLRALQGHLQFESGLLQAHDIEFDTLGGKLATDIKVEHLEAAPSVRIRTQLRAVSLSAAQHAVRQAAAQSNRIAVSGRLDGSVEASWNDSVKNIIARSDLTLASYRHPDQTAPARTLPITGAIHAAYDGSRKSVAFENTSLRIPSASVTLQGQIGDHSSLQLQARASDLHQVADLLAALGIQQASSLELTGSAALHASVQGSTRAPQISGQFSAQNVQVQGSEWRTAQAQFQASPSQFAIRNALLVNAHQGQASMNASVALNRWTYLPSNAISGEISVRKLSLADLQRLANSHYPVSGDLSANLSLRGSQLNPVGGGSAAIDHARVQSEPILHLAATFSADRGSLSSTLNLSLAAGNADATLTYRPNDKSYLVRLNAPAILLQKLQTVQAMNPGIDGAISISASGQGTLDNPQLQASIAIPKLQLRDKSFSQIKAQLNIANRHAELSLDSSVAQATVRAHANVNLTGDYSTEAAIDTSAVSLGPLLALASSQSPQGLQGETELHATVSGPLKDPSKLVAHLTIPRLKASYQSLEIGAAGPIRADFANSILTLQPAEIRGTGTTLKIQGSIPLSGAAAPSLTAHGSIDARVLEIFNPEAQSSGTVALDIRASGSARNPTVEGKLRFQNVAVNTPNAPLGVRKLDGDLQIVNRSLELNGLTAEVGGGRVSVGGSISYRPNLQFNVTLQSHGVRVRYPEGVRAVFDGNLALAGTKDSSTLNGRVLIDSLSFTPDFDLAKFSDQFSGAAVPSAPGLLDNVKLAIGVQSKTSLSAGSTQLSVEGEANLQVVGTAASPVIVGRTDLSSGELFYRNVRYQLQRGVITFDNPTQTEPTLNVSATTSIEQYNLTIGLRGPFDRLTTSYTSDPPLATADVISLIANGQTTSQASAAGTSTDSILASQAASQVTGGIQHLAGISSLQIDPLLGGSNQNPSARVAIQQRVTRNFLFTFSTDLSQPGAEVVQGDYRINQRWSVSVTRDELGGISVDGKFHTKF
jgi:translocation and assembly module TamB